VLSQQLRRRRRARYFSQLVTVVEERSRSDVGWPDLGHQHWTPNGTIDHELVQSCRQNVDNMAKRAALHFSTFIDTDVRFLTTE
jgi:hypothetical protein